MVTRIDRSACEGVTHACAPSSDRSSAERGDRRLSSAASRATPPPPSGARRSLGTTRERDRAARPDGSDPPGAPFITEEQPWT